MTPKTLFDNDDPDKVPPKMPHNGTPTSKIAAQSMRSSAGAQQQRVLDCLQQAGDAGLTDEELQAALDLSGNSERPRRRKLVELGLVKDSGTMRLTHSKSSAVVWIVSPPHQKSAAGG